MNGSFGRIFSVAVLRRWWFTNIIEDDATGWLAPVLHCAVWHNSCHLPCVPSGLQPPSQNMFLLVSTQRRTQFRTPA